MRSTLGTAATVPDCVPSDEISKAADTYAREHLHPAIFNHSLRVYLLARGLGTREASPYVQKEQLHLLFTACIMHDIGTTTAHNGPQRFEVEGADAAATFLKSHNVSEADAHDVWTAIAIHTSPGIAERISPLSRLVRLAVAMDFKRPTALKLVTRDEMESIEKNFPRGEIEKVLGDAVVERVVERASEQAGDPVEAMNIVDVKAPAASWPGVLVKSASENRGWEGVNKAF